MQPTHLDVQKRQTLKTQASAIGSDWYLAGGTALDIHLGHRGSRDLDWFSPQATSYDRLRSTLREARPTYSGQGPVVPDGSIHRFYYGDLETSFVVFSRFDFAGTGVGLRSVLLQ